MNNIVLGKYLSLDSIVHNMDPRAKIISMLILMIALFFPSGFIGYFIMFTVIVCVLKLAKIKLNFILTALKPMYLMMIFLLIINIFVVKTGDLLINFKFIQIYSDALFQTLYIAIRLVLMVMITTTLTATTKPLDLTLGIEDLLEPFKKFKVPAHEIAMLISIALRFIPDLIEETQKIMKAQASRGADLASGNFKEKIMAILALIVPLFVSSLQRADDLANAMEARGYSPGMTRTRYKVLKMKNYDYVLLICSFMLCFVMFILGNIYG